MKVVESFYESSEYKRLNPTWHVEDSPWKSDKIMKIIARNDLQPKSICEIGCGAGELLRQLLLKMNDDVSFVGYEISPDAFELCLTRKSDRLIFKLENLLESPPPPCRPETAIQGSKKLMHTPGEGFGCSSSFPVQYYDIVMAIDVIEHVEDVFGFLRKLKSYGVYKIFHIPLDISVQTIARLTPLEVKRKIVGHLHYFTKNTALGTLSHCGYEIIDWFYTAGELELPNRTFKSHLLRLPRKIGYSFARDVTVRLFGGYSLLVLAK